MNVLHISRTMGQGGAEKIVYQLSVSMKNQIRNICVASAGGGYVDLLSKCGIKHYQIADLECKNPFVILDTILRLQRIIKEEKIDIVHTHHRMAAFYAYVLKKLNADIKLIYTAHNVFNNKKCFTKRILTGVEVVAVGDNVKKNLINYFQIDQRKIHLIYNAIYPESIHNLNRNRILDRWKEEGFYLLGCIGRLTEQKGVDIFLRIILEMKKNKKNIKGIIVGTGPLKDQLIHQMNELNLSNEITFLGYQKNIFALISQMDLIVMPSRWEGFPLLPLEVFAMKKTIVGSDIGGINELIIDGKNGRLVEKDNVQMFEQAISNLLFNEVLRNKMEKKGFEFYKQNFSYEKFIEKYYYLYQNILYKE